MPPLALKFLSEDAHLTELARLYWELDQEEKAFTNQVKGLASRFSVPANQVLKTVLESCEASSPVIVCETCGRPQQYKSRNDFLDGQRHYRRYGSWRCWDCICEEERRRREEERVRRALAEQQALALRRRQKELVEKTYARQEARNYLLPTELSLTTAIYLLGGIRAGGLVCRPLQRRPAYPPQSVISRLFFDTVLGISDDGFFKAPRDVDPSSLDRYLIAGSI